MTANQVIDAYVTDVAAHLPRKQRNDVAFELRALLHEELEGKAGDSGREADSAMAVELVRAFGRPSDVAARYRPALTIIDPEDGHAFWRTTRIGLVVIWVLGLAGQLRAPLPTGWDWLSLVGQWWVGTVIPSLWWPGVLVVGYGLSAWTRRRWPHRAEWSPRTGEQGEPGRASTTLAIVGILCGVYVLTDPTLVLDAIFGGHAAPVAYQALTYTEAFKRHQAPLLFVVLALQIPLLLTVMVNGCWTLTARRFEQGLALVMCGLLVWTVASGPVFMGSASDQAFKGAAVLIVVLTLIHVALSFGRRVRPAPDQELGS